MRHSQCLQTIILISFTSLAKNDLIYACWELIVERPMEETWVGYILGTESDVFSLTTCPSQNSCTKEHDTSGVVLVNQNHTVASRCFCSIASFSSASYGSHAGCPKVTVSNINDAENVSFRSKQQSKQVAGSSSVVESYKAKLNYTSSSVGDGVGLFQGKTRLPYPLLVVYSGPTTMSVQPNDKKKTNMYHDNFRYFLEQGLPCSHHFSTYSSREGRVAVTVAVVLTNETLQAYRNILRNANAHCGGVEVIVRENQCYDLESARVALTSHRIATHRSFVFVNCGLMGPFLPYGSLDQESQYWPLLFTSALDDHVKMTGLTVNCQTKLTKRTGERLPHVQVSHSILSLHLFNSELTFSPKWQSFLWATDHKGLMAIFSAHSIFYCGSLLSKKRGRAELIEHYEVRMGRGIQEAGFDIRPMSAAQNFNVSLNFVRNASFPGWCRDIWGDESMKDAYGRLMTGPEAVFWKRSRFYPASIKEYASRQRKEYPSEDGFQAQSKDLPMKSDSGGNQTGLSGLLSMLKLQMNKWAPTSATASTTASTTATTSFLNIILTR